MLNEKDLARFNNYIEKTGTCWVWHGPNNGRGYGQFGINKTRLYAHRVSYEHFKGTIPKGLVIDHLCRNPSCVNPAHLEAVEERENIIRGEAPTIKVFKSGWCKKGLHKMEGNNIKVQPNGHRRCRACENEAKRAAYHKDITRSRALSKAAIERRHEEVLALRRKYYHEHKDRIMELRRIKENERKGK